MTAPAARTPALYDVVALDGASFVIVALEPNGAAYVGRWRGAEVEERTVDADQVGRWSWDDGGRRWVAP